jgi:D-sedoheptulose 7-phosphate isomerase
MGPKFNPAGDGHLVQVPGWVAVVIFDIASRVRTFADVVAGAHATDMRGNDLGLEAAIDNVLNALREARSNRGRLYIIGNGGSSAIAAHAVNDFVNMTRINAHTLHDPALLTCMANDYGYENAYARILGRFSYPEDVLIAISSSGRSENIRNAAAIFGAAGGMVVTLTGFGGGNPLRSMGGVNFWLDASDYGIVEIGHQFILHNLADRLAAETP